MFHVLSLAQGEFVWGLSDYGVNPISLGKKVGTLKLVHNAKQFTLEFGYCSKSCIEEMQDQELVAYWC